MNHVSGYSEAYHDGAKVDPEAENPHSLMLLKGTHHLINHHDLRAKNLFDMIALRLHNPKGFRKHFPVVMEVSENPNFVLEEMQSMMNVPLDSIALAEWTGFDQVSNLMHLSKLFTKE